MCSHFFDTDKLSFFPMCKGISKKGHNDTHKLQILALAWAKWVFVQLKFQVLSMEEQVLYHSITYHSATWDKLIK